MPQFDTTFFASQIFWTAVSFMVLFFVLKRWVLPPITRVLQQRAQLISQEISGAESIRAQAEEIKTEYEQQLAGIEQQKAAMLSEVEKEMLIKRQHSLSALEDEIHLKKRQFLEDEAVLRKQSVREISKQSAELVVAATEQLIARKLEEADAQMMLEQIVCELDLKSVDELQKKTKRSL